MMENVTCIVRFVALVASILLDSFVIWWILYSLFKNPTMSMKTRFSRGANVFWKVALFKKLPKKNTVSLKSTAVFFVLLCIVSILATIWGVGGCKKFFVGRYNEQLGAVSYFMTNAGFGEWIDYSYIEQAYEDLTEFSYDNALDSKLESKIRMYCDKTAESDVQAREWHRFIEVMSLGLERVVRLDVRGEYMSKSVDAQGSRSFYVTMEQLDSLYRFYGERGGKSCNLNFKPIPYGVKSEKEATCLFENEGFRFLFSGVTQDTLSLRKKMNMYKKMCDRFK